MNAKSNRSRGGGYGYLSRHISLLLLCACVCPASPQDNGTAAAPKPGVVIFTPDTEYRYTAFFDLFFGTKNKGETVEVIDANGYIVRSVSAYGFRFLVLGVNNVDELEDFFNTDRALQAQLREIVRYAKGNGEDPRNVPPTAVNTPSTPSPLSDKRSPDAIPRASERAPETSAPIGDLPQSREIRLYSPLRGRPILISSIMDSMVSGRPGFDVRLYYPGTSELVRGTKDGVPGS